MRPLCAIHMRQTSNPARDLLDTLREASGARRISLIVCTNRGVLEKAFRDTYLDPAVNQQAWHKAILRPLADSANGAKLPLDPIPPASRRPVFTSILTTTSFLGQHRSLIPLGKGIFDRLIVHAVQVERWAACGECPVATLCPVQGKP